MKKIKYLKIGVIISIISILGGIGYWKLTNRLLTIKKISDILFIEFLVIFTIGNFMYFKEKFWNRPWEKLKKKKIKKRRTKKRSQGTMLKKKLRRILNLKIKKKLD